MDCPHCKTQYEREALLQNLMVCPECGCHLRMDAADRIAYIADKNSFEELDTNLRTMNPINMAGYEERGSRKNPCHSVYDIGGSPYAGGTLFADADGENLKRRCGAG